MRQHKFGAVKADIVVYNKLTTGLPYDLGVFARISKFRCFHETKQTQNEVERFFSKTWPDFFWNTVSRRNLATFAKFCLNSVFAT